LALFSYVIINNTESNYETFDQFSYRNTDNFNLDIFRVDNEYFDNFQTILGEIKETKSVSLAFKNNMVFYLLINFFIGSSVPPSLNISLAYILENALNDQMIYWNYLVYMQTSIIGFVLITIMISFLDGILMFSLILGISHITCAIVILFCLHESPRYLYEYGDYKEITRIFRIIVPTELDKLYVCPEKNNDNGKKPFEQELQIIEKSTTKSIMREIEENTFFHNHIINKKKLIKEIKEKDFCNISRANFVKDPILLYNIIYSNPQINKNLFIIISFVINCSICYFIVVNSLNKDFISTRISAINDKYIFNSTFFWIGVLQVLSCFAIYWILKFFGYSMLLFIGFGFTIIFSFLLELFSIFYKDNNDINSYLYTITQYYSGNISTLTSLTFLVSISVNIVYFLMFFYLTKFTKTQYRCSFYGVCRIYFDLMMIMVNAIVLFFEKTMFYVAIASILGFINTYFMGQDFDYNMITDFRVVELNKVDEKE